MPRNSTKQSKLLALAFIAIAASIAVFAIGASGVIPWFQFSILPGFEGMTAGVEGVTISGSFYANTASTRMPAGYSWLSNDARYPILVKNLQPGTCAGEARIETRSAYQVSDALTVGRTVDYWVKDGGEYVHVKGEVITYSIPITFAVTNTWGGNPMDYPDIFNGEKVWFTIGSLTWNKALQEQSPVSGASSAFGQAWEAPIYAVIQDYTVADAGLHYKVAPRDIGREITLYSSTSQSGTVSGLWGSEDLNGTLAGSLSPDSRMQQRAFVCFTLEDFGEEVVNAGLGGAHTPTVNIVVKVYALRIGEFTYTNVDDTPWATEAPDTVKPWWAWITDPIGAYFSSPLTIFGIFLALGIAILVLVVIFFIFTGTGRAVDAAIASRHPAGSKKGSLKLGGAILVLGLVMLSAGVALPMAGVSLPGFSIMGETAPSLGIGCKAAVQVGEPMTVNARLGYTVYGNMVEEPFGGETLNFYLDGVYLGSATTSQDAEPALCGRASYTVTAWTPGLHTVKVEWAGNANYSAISREASFTATATDPGTGGDGGTEYGASAPTYLNWLTIAGAGITAVGIIAAAFSSLVLSRGSKARSRRRP